MDPTRRSGFVAEACAGEPDLELEVAQLLQSLETDELFTGTEQAEAWGNAVKVPLEEASFLIDSPDPRIVSMDEALTKLAVIDERKAKIVEMLFFGGFTLAEISETLGGSASTVHREVKFAKAWMFQEVSRTQPSSRQSV